MTRAHYLDTLAYLGYMWTHNGDGWQLVEGKSMAMAMAYIAEAMAG